MKFPSKKKLEEMDKILEKAAGNLWLDDDATAAEKFRWDLCERLAAYMRKQKWTQVELADFLKVDQARVSEVLNHRTDKVSTDKLLSYIEKIEPKVKFGILKPS